LHNDEKQCYLAATCWVNETIVFIINQSETSQILIVTNSTQALINGHDIILVYFPQFCEIQKFADFTQKMEILVKITLKKPNLVQNFHFKKIHHIAKIHSQLLITANQIPNTQHVLRDHHNKPVSDVVAQNEGEQLQWGSNISGCKRSLK